MAGLGLFGAGSLTPRGETTTKKNNHLSYDASKRHVYFNNMDKWERGGMVLKERTKIHAQSSVPVLVKVQEWPGSNGDERRMRSSINRMHKISSRREQLPSICGG